MPNKDGVKIVSKKVTRISAIVLAGALLTACNTVSMPDLVDLPEFSEAIEGSDKLKYPNPSDAPAAPDDVRSASDWDRAAKNLIRKRDGFEAPADMSGGQSDQELEENFDALKAKVEEYKLDDPIEY